jgi:hypothetical protein
MKRMPAIYASSGSLRESHRQTEPEKVDRTPWQKAKDGESLFQKLPSSDPMHGVQGAMSLGSAVQGG